MRGWRKFNLSIPDFFHSLGEFGADCLLVLGRIQKVDQRQSRFFLCIVGGHLGKAKDRALIVLGVGKGFDVGQSFVWGGLMPLQQWAAKTSWFTDSDEKLGGFLRVGVDEAIYEG